jgi:hypothetical protein
MGLLVRQVSAELARKVVIGCCSALAELEADVECWADVWPGEARLTEFLVPRVFRGPHPLSHRFRLPFVAFESARGIDPVDFDSRD